MAKRRFSPPRYKTGPKKGQFKPRSARRNPSSRRSHAQKVSWAVGYRKLPKSASATTRAKQAYRQAAYRRALRAAGTSPLKNPLTDAMRKAMRGIDAPAPKRRSPAKRKRKTTAAKQVKPVVVVVKPPAAKRAAKKRGATTVAKKKAKKTKRAKRAAPRRGKPTKAARSAAARKGWRKRRAKKSAAKRVRAKSGSRRRVRRNPGRTYKHKAAAPQKTKRGRYKRKGRVAKQKLYLSPRPGAGPVPYRLRRRRMPRSYKYRVTRNPMTTLKTALTQGGMIYAGFFASRALGSFINSKLSTVGSLATLPTAAKAAIGPAAVAIGAALLGPKIFKGKLAGLTQALAQGAVLAIGDILAKQLIPAETLPSVGLSEYVSGYGGYGLQEYVPQQIGMGAEVSEAMALDEYVQSGGMGVNVEEALASPGLSSDEIAYMQQGGAGGSLSRTVFSS